MYKEFEIRASYNYLKEVIKNLDEPICMLGGWAVFFHANKKFEKAQGRPYLGSRDIDLGFNMKGDLRKSALSKSIAILTGRLNFKPISFRLMKDMHTETEEEIKGGKIVPAHFVFPMYVDLVVDSIPENFRSVFGFNPIDEPLLKIVFEKKEFIIVKEFGKNIFLPKVDLLLAMKASSLPNRDREHKKVKDICDMFALVWYTDINPEEVTLTRYVSLNILERCLKSITNEDFEKAAAQLGHGKEELKRVISLICEKK